jgi:hypothetical protein
MWHDVGLVRTYISKVPSHLGRKFHVKKRTCRWLRLNSIKKDNIQDKVGDELLGMSEMGGSQ